MIWLIRTLLASFGSLSIIFLAILVVLVILITGYDASFKGPAAEVFKQLGSYIQKMGVDLPQFHYDQAIKNAKNVILQFPNSGK